MKKVVSVTSWAVLALAARERELCLGEGPGMCPSGLVSGGPPTHCIIAAAFYLLLFVAPLAETLRTKLVEDLLGRYG